MRFPKVFVGHFGGKINFGASQIVFEDLNSTTELLDFVLVGFRKGFLNK